MKYTFTQTFWLYVTVIYEYLEHIGLFTCNCHNSSSTELDFVLQYATNIITSNLHMKKVIEVSTLNPDATHTQPNVPTLFLLIKKVHNYKHGCFQVEACCELKLAITFLPKIIWMVTNTEPCIRASSCILYWSLHL